eukprot:g4847.t1
MGATSCTSATTLRSFLRNAPKELYLIYLLKYCESYAYFVFSYVLILFLSDEFSLSDETAGVVYGVHGMLISVYGFLMGTVVDSVGVKWSVTFGMIILFLSRLLLVFTSSLHSMLTILFVFMPIGCSLAVPVLQIGIKRLTLPGDRVLAYSLFYVIMNLAAITAAPAVDAFRTRFPLGLKFTLFGFGGGGAGGSSAAGVGEGHDLAGVVQLGGGAGDENAFSAAATGRTTIPSFDSSLVSPPTSTSLNLNMNLSPEVFEISAFRLLILSGAGVTFLSMFIALTLLRDLEMLPDGTLLELEGGVPVTAGGMIGGGAPDDVRAQDLEDILLAQSLSGSRSSRPVGEAGFQEHLVSDAFSRQRRGFGGGVEGQGASSTSPGKTSSTSASSSTGAGKYVKMATLKSNADVATGFCSASCRPAAPRPQIPLQPPFLKSPCALYSEVFRSDSFWRFFLLVSLLIGVRVIFRYLDALFPKYLIRELGPTALYGSVIALDPLLILFLVPTISLLTMNKISSLNMIIFGSFLSAVAPFWLALGHQYWNSILFICTLAVGEACWSPRLYEYTMRMAEPGKEGTYTALANAPMFCATLIAGSFSGYLLEIFCPENGPKHGEVMWLIVGITSTCSPIALYFARDVIAGVPTVGMGRKMDLGAPIQPCPVRIEQSERELSGAVIANLLKDNVVLDENCQLYDATLKRLVREVTTLRRKIAMLEAKLEAAMRMRGEEYQYAEMSRAGNQLSEKEEYVRHLEKELVRVQLHNNEMLKLIHEVAYAEEEDEGEQMNDRSRSGEVLGKPSDGVSAEAGAAATRKQKKAADQVGKQDLLVGASKVDTEEVGGAAELRREKAVLEEENRILREHLFEKVDFLEQVGQDLRHCSYPLMYIGSGGGNHPHGTELGHGVPASARQSVQEEYEFLSWWRRSASASPHV